MEPNLQGLSSMPIHYFLIENSLALATLIAQEHPQGEFTCQLEIY